MALDSVTCRLYRESDRDGVARLVMALQQFHKIPLQSYDTICADLQNMPVSFELWVSVDLNDNICGFALLCLIPGPGVSCGLYLKELFVAEEKRNQGIGRRLIQTVASSAIKRGFSRIDWVTGRGNGAARKLYDDLGAVADPEKLYYRLQGQPLASLADKGTCREPQ